MNSPKSMFSRITSVALVVAIMLSFLSVVPTSKSFDDLAITASAAGSPGKGKKTVVTTAPYETTTSTTTTTTAVTTFSTTSPKKKTITSTESFTTTSSTTTETTTESTTESTTTETTTTETTTITTTTTTHATTLTTESTVMTKKTAESTQPYSSETSATTLPESTKKWIATTASYPVGSLDSFPADTVRPHKAYIAQGKGWFSVTRTMEDATAMAKYNGFASVNDPILAGWYSVPPGMEIPVNTKLYIDPTSTLWSVVHNVRLVNIILDFNGGSYSGTTVNIPAGLVLNVNSAESVNFNGSEPAVTEAPATTETTAVATVETVLTTESSTTETTTTEETTTESATTETTTSDNSLELAKQEAAKQEAARIKAEEEVAKQEAARLEAEKEAQEQETAKLEAEKEAEKAKAAAEEFQKQLSKALEESQKNAQKADNYQQLMEQLKVKNSFLMKDFDKMLSTLNINLVGFALGTDDEAFAYCNENTLFSANCIAKPAVVALLLQKMQENNIPLDTKIVICSSDIPAYTTWMNAERGFTVGTETTLLECGYCAISLSDNTAYNIIKRYLKETFKIDVDQWRLQKFDHQKDGGSYGKITAKNMFKEAQYVLEFLKEDTSYSNCLKDWLRMEDIYYDSVFVDSLDMNFAYVGYKIGWFGESQTEMVFMQDQYGNWYIAVFLTKKDGTDTIAKVASWISEEYKRLLNQVTLGQVII